MSMSHKRSALPRQSRSGAAVFAPVAAGRDREEAPSIPSPRQLVRFGREFGIRLHWIVILFVLFFASVLFEGIGIGLFLPILEYMNNDGRVETLADSSMLWEYIFSLFNFIDIDVSLAGLAAIVFLCVLARQCFVYFRNIYMTWIEQNIICDVLCHGYGQFLSADLAYVDQMRSGEFLNELTVELSDGIHNLISMANYYGMILLCFAYISILMMLSVTMTIAALIVLIATAALILMLSRRIGQFGRDSINANQDLATYLMERIKSAALIRLSCMQRAESTAIRQLACNRRDHRISINKLIALAQSTMEPVVIGFGFVLLIVSHSFFDVSVAEMLLFFVILIRLLPYIREMIMTRQTVIARSACIDVVRRRLIALGECQEDFSGDIAMPTITDGITLDNVSFSYDNADAGTVALNGISMFIAKGRMTALAGPSGGGKSTLISLLPRLRTPDSGDIRIDTIPLSRIDIHQLRSAIAFVPQAPRILNVTPAQHIRYGRPDASDAEIRDAARQAGADAFIRALPDGYDTLLEEDGNRLSGGQRQRLDLARALVQEAQILILDEPTSNLDVESEAAFSAVLERLRRETAQTIIVVGHRLSTIAMADQIIVLSGGTVLESGRDADLVAAGGWYQKARRHQVDSLVS